MSSGSNDSLLDSPIELMITPRARDLGGFTVKRVLPFMKHRTVGPFIFLDHAGPIAVTPDSGMDVRPHPHIGLSTVTYLFEGSSFHRDSLGSAQSVVPGDLNWMTAGRGIVHSERTPSEVRKAGGFLHGLQSWVALPKAFEEVEPSFQHHASKTLPEFSEKGVQLKLLVGTAFGQASPAQTYSDIFYIEAKMKAGQKIILPNPGRESAIYPIRGNAKVSGVDVAEGIMAVGKVNATLEIEALGDLHAVFLGGAPLDGNREIWWNFVSSSHERIERAKTEWRERQFPSIPGDDREFIPPPDA